MKNLRKIEEFCQYDRDPSFRNAIEDLFELIESEGCRISARYDCDMCVHEFEKDFNCQIRIPINEFKNNSHEMLYVILHELGHHISGNFDKENKSFSYILARESEAWDYARKYILRSINPIFKYHTKFENYVLKCINTYKVSK